jgi:hypothetical protein
MRQLHASNTALLMNKADDSSQRLNVIVTPDAQILRTNAAFRQNCRGFCKHQASTAYGAAREMDKMPVVRVSIGAGVLTHW